MLKLVVGVVGVVAMFTCVGVAGKLPMGTLTFVAETEFLLPGSNLVFFERDFVDFLLILPSDDLAGSSAEPPPDVFILFSYVICVIYFTFATARRFKRYFINKFGKQLIDAADTLWRSVDRQSILS